MTRRWIAYTRVAALALVAATLSDAFYLPGVAPTEYHDNAHVPLMVNALTPGSDSELKSVIAYDYYSPMLNFCQPSDGIQAQAESLGSILFGDRIWDSAFEIHMLQPKYCDKLCDIDVTAEQATFINNRIRENYVINWLIDGLPVGYARPGIGKDQDQKLYSIGFPLGVEEGKESPKLNNHYDISIEYHKNRQKN
ncbi:hypothetical protein BGX34_002855, partial [Mortierella sp. NVP85]